MTEHKEFKLLPFNSKQLYDIILDVELYPEFLPWCNKAVIIKNTNSNLFEAELTIGYNSINKSYLSRVSTRCNSEIKSTAIAGPFSYMENIWKFNDKRNNSCLLEFKINFEFKSLLLNTLIGSVFSSASKKMVKAFEQRAYDLYGG